MEIHNIKVSEIKPYKRNPRNNDQAVDAVVESIKSFGFKVPIVLDRNNVIIAGHTRVKAAKRLGLDVVPCVIADDLTDEQARAFRIADNKVAELADWDYTLLDEEINELLDFRFEDFGFDFPEVLPKEDQERQNERERTINAYHLRETSDLALTSDFWQMPIILNNGYVPEDMIGFNYAKTSAKKNCGIHFYIDDYQFERIWNDPESYVDILSEYDCILSPDFSLYMDMPMALKIWNIYRSRWIGAYYQKKGLNVIPTASWAEPETYEFCFQGIPKGSIVSVSTIGVKKEESALKVWIDGMKEMIRRIEPETILVYGGELPFDYGDIPVRYYENKVTEQMKRES